MTAVAKDILPAMETIKNKILTDGPYDGIGGFSQGSAFTRLFMHIVTTIDPESYKELEGKMPKFIMQFCENRSD